MERHPPSQRSKTALLGSVASIWPLLFGVALLMMANGLQGSLLGVRAEAEAFNATMIGIIMSGYFAGLLAGSIWTPRAVSVVGHVRVFAAMSAVASISILIHAFYINEGAWLAMRVLTGFCYAGIFVVAESWLNAKTPQSFRGQILALYFAVSFLGMGVGQLLLNISGVRAADLFMLVSVLISAAAVPMLLSAVPLPKKESEQRVSIRRLLAASPLGMAGVFTAGITNGTIFGMGAVYAQSSGLNIYQTSIFMMLIIFGAALLQWPIGRMSDVIGRRTVMVSVSLVSSIIAIFSFKSGDISTIGGSLLIAATGGLSLSIQSLSVAYTNDHLNPQEMVGASSGIVLIRGAGSVIGPIFVGLAFALGGPSTYFQWLAFVNIALFVFSLWRMSRRKAMPKGAQSPYIPSPPQIATNTEARNVRIDGTDE